MILPINGRDGTSGDMINDTQEPEMWQSPLDFDPRPDETPLSCDTPQSLRYD